MASPDDSEKKPEWKKKHESFIETIRAAKAMQKHLKNGGKLSDLPPPPPSDTSDYIQCPHCKRRFSPGAADRHIPKCANIKSNKPKWQARHFENPPRIVQYIERDSLARQ